MTSVLAQAVLSIAVVLLILWAILMYLKWKSARPIVLPVSEKLTVFRAACSCLGIDLHDVELLDAYFKLLPNYENPYVAAMEGWVKRWSALTSPGGESYDRPIAGTLRPSGENAPDLETDRIEIEHDLGLRALCDFVVEGHLSHDEGKRYFDQLTEMWRKMDLKNGYAPMELTSFDSMLDAQRTNHSSPLAEGRTGVLP